MPIKEPRAHRRSLRVARAKNLGSHNRWRIMGLYPGLPEWRPVPRFGL